MHGWKMAAISVVALTGAACQTLDDRHALANAQSPRQDCKAVAAASTAESMRADSARGVETDDMRRAEGTFALQRLQLRDRRFMENKAQPEGGLVGKALRDC